MRITYVNFTTLSGDGTHGRCITSMGWPGEKFHFAPRGNVIFTMPATQCSSGGAPLTPASVGVLGDTTLLSERSCIIEVVTLYLF